MSTTSKKLTLTEVKRRVDELYTYRKTVKGGFRWDDPEHCQGLIDRLREAVIQAIAEGSKLPYALTRCIAELPRVDYGTIPTEPVRTTVTKVAASTMYGKRPCVDCRESMELDENGRCCHCRTHHLPTENRIDEIALIDRYQHCVSELLSMFPSDPLGKCPAHFYIERLEELVKQKLLRPNLPVSKVTIPTEPARTTVTKIAASSMYGVIKEAWKDDNKLSNCMTSEQAYAIGEYLGRGYDDEVPASAYPPGMTPEELREAFDRLLDRFTKMEKTIIDTAAVFAKICEEPTLSD